MHRNILRHLYLWVLMLLPQLSWGQFIWHEDMGSPSVTGRVTLSYDTTSYVFDTVNAEEHSDADEVWDDLNSQFESAGITWAEIYELGKEESESFTVRLRMDVNTGYGDRYLNFGHNGAELVICQQGMPLPDPEPEPEPEPEPDPEPEPEPSSPYDTTLNWILTKTYNSDGSSYEDIVYYDGLGYARQSVMINGRGTGDIVKMHSFDVFGRETRDWLPYSKVGGGGFDASAQASQQAYYKGLYPSIANQNDIRGYTETVYESGSSGRVLRQHIQGQEYADTLRSTRTHYRGNGPTDVPVLDYVESSGAFVQTGHYAPNTLTGVETVLPSGERQRVWSDLDGRTVMQESCGPDGWVKTLYCYDVRGQLHAVVTPEGVKQLTEGTEYNWSSPLLQNYAYVYAYDGQGRMSCRRLPSCSEEYFVYDRGGNVVMRQNGLLRAQNQWIGIFYDRLGRVTSERLLTGTAGSVQDLSLVRSYQNLFDEGHSPSVYSPTGGTLLLENTYDSYPTNLSSAESFSADGLNVSYDTRTKSLLTVQRLARITENGVEPSMCRRVFYYDAYGNVLQTVEKDGLRTLRHTSVRDLLGNVLTDRQTVTRSNVTDTWQTDYTYDPRGRVLRTVGTLNGQQVSDVSYGYDSVGELSYKSYCQNGGYFHEHVKRNLQQDPLAEKYYNISPYAYCANNPVNFVDPDGEAWIKALKTTGKAVYKTVKAGRKVSVKGVLKSTALDIVDNVHTLFDQDASGLEKAIAGFDLVTGFGDEAKLLAKTVGVSDAIVDGNRATDAVKNRVKLRKSTRETIIEQAPKNANGDFIDPNTGMIVSKDGPFDIGHKQGESWKKRKHEHIEKGSTRKEVIEAENNPNLYQIEDPKSNRSRKYD